MAVLHGGTKNELRARPQTGIFVLPLSSARCTTCGCCLGVRVKSTAVFTFAFFKILHGLARTAHVPLAQTRAACLWQIAGHLDIPVKRLQRYLELTQESVSFEVRSESAFAIPQVPAYNTTACAQ